MTKIEGFHDKLLPMQAPLRDHFPGDDRTLAMAMEAGMNRWCDAGQLQALGHACSPRFTQAEMGSAPFEQAFLQTLVLLRRPMRILEIGSLYGAAAIAFSRVQPEGGEVVTIERFSEFAEVARANIRAQGLEHRIRLLEGDAFDVISGLPPEMTLDMAFIDGNKERYLEYFELCDKRLNPGGVILVDDVFFHGDVFNDVPTTEKGAGVKRFLEAAKDMTGYHKAILPIANGVMIMTKL